MKNKLEIKDDPIKEIITIEGIQYSYEFFKSFGVSGLPIGAAVRIIKREDGGITVERIQE